MELRPETPDSSKPNTATTAFARSRLPRSLLIAHSAAADAGFVWVWIYQLWAKSSCSDQALVKNESLLCLICRYSIFRDPNKSQQTKGPNLVSHYTLMNEGYLDAVLEADIGVVIKW